MKFCAVLRTHPTDTPGGSELQSQLICSELSRRGNEVYYIAYRSDESTTVEHEGVNVVRLNVADGYRGKKETLSKIIDLDPDVLYFRILKDLPLAATLKQLTDAHIAFNISHDAHCLPRFAGWPGKRNATLVHSGYRRLKLAFLRSLLAIPDTIFAQTRTQQQLLAKHWDTRSILTGNGLPVPESEPEKHAPPVVLWLASIKKWKQPHVFIDVAESCADLECEFWMVGQPMDTTLAEKIEERVDTVPNLEYFGGCTVKESNDYIEKASIFMNTSKQEGFPNTFLQSWFRKTPVVSLHADPVNQQGEFRTGYYDVGEQSDLIRKTRDLIERPGLRQNAAEQAYSYACENYDIRGVVDRIEHGLPDDVYD